MAQNWTFGRKVGAGFAVTVALAVAIGAVAIYALRTAVASKDRVIEIHAQNVVDSWQIGFVISRKNVVARGFMIDGNEKSLDEERNLRSRTLSYMAQIRQRMSDPEGRRLLEDLVQKEADHNGAVERLIALRRTNPSIESIVKAFDEDEEPRRKPQALAIDALAAYLERLIEQEKIAATQAASAAENALIAMIVALILAATGIAVVLTRTLSRQIGTATGQVQSSSAELQAAANQQASGAKEQATAMSEITTTIGELLATSRQIALSAQRVAQIAEQTATAARSGGDTVPRAHESIVGIRRQVDQIVSHMLDLGKKSQQIGAVLDIVLELAEQTNILAINATIEAAGAGDAGKRFAVVAEEIRKLADRVAGSAKEIRGLIEDVRGAVNTTVMATESGSKAVDAGTAQVADVVSTFKQIAGLVATTTETAREIELSTKQQATAVEQLNIAIADVSQATNETEASAGQTLQTASELAGLSRNLMRLVQPQASG
ncbi:MAG: hypothetical protein HYR63_15395 [Proteobacteria bacterium]|nr:hypothetical protein [Pseudomonadota bacterium]